MLKKGVPVVLASLAVAYGSCPDDVIQDASLCADGIEGILTEETFNSFFKGRDIEPGCDARAKQLFTFDNLVATQKELSYFANFASVGDCTMRKRELVAFLAQTSHETNGGWADAPCNPKSYGYCYCEETVCVPGGSSYPCTSYCDPWADCMGNYGVECPCTEGKTYHGRGPIQLSWNYNYAAFSNDVFGDNSVLLDPDIVLQDGKIAWASALWFWMKAQAPKPSNHDIMTDVWVPDTSIGYRGGFGAVTHVINGGLECGCDKDLHYDKPVSRMDYFLRYSNMVGITGSECSSPDHTLLCRGMPPYFGTSPSSCGGPSSDTCTDRANGGGGQQPPSGTNPPSATNPPAATDKPVTNPPAATDAPVDQPPAGGSTCLHNTDCVSNSWCTDTSYEVWCAQQVAADPTYCPMPYCVWARRSLLQKMMASEFGKKLMMRS